MWVGVLGPTLVSDAGRSIEIQTAKHRALLSALALASGRALSSESLIATLWGAGAPPSAAGTLQTYVSAVRRLLEPGLEPRATSSYLASVDGGYRLRADLDGAEFTTTVREVHAAMAPLTAAAVPVAEDPSEVALLQERLDAVLALWRGEPYADLPDSDLVVPERSRLRELWLLAREDRATLLVAAGRDAEAAAELEALTIEEPLRERPRALLAIALARSGRQADALAALDSLRSVLDEELGLEPSHAVHELQTTILRQELPVPRPRRSPAGPTGHAGQAGTVRRERPEAVGEPAQTTIVLPHWSMVGREAQLDVLEAALAAAEGGSPQFVTIRGAAGAGKTRLGAEFALRAQQRGALVLVGRCSQEEDAPPLWPWLQALGDSVAGLDDAEPDHDAARFAVAESIRGTLADLARDRTVVLGLEDLHWADTSTLRVLRHLAAHLDVGRLLIVCTWRRGARVHLRPLAEAAEALARRHATHLEVDGLSVDQTAQLIAEVTGQTDPGLAAALHQRTDGNPFFLIEYGRLARDERADPRTVLDQVPPTVAAVVDRRIAQLPERTREAMTAAAVIGREFGLDLLSGAIRVEEDAALDMLEPALEGDLIADLGGDRYRFAHALVRDGAYSALAASRRERMHATVAGLVETAPDADRRAAEVARHWTAAGRRHRRRACTAAAYAGDRAMSAHAADEARDHYAAALALYDEDDAGLARERYDLLVRYAEACRWSTRRLEMHAAIDEAVILAGGLDDPELVVRAATIATSDALWPARSYHEHNDDVIAVIRGTLPALPRDSALRARLLLALAAESYYAAQSQELDALCEEAIATARRIEDPRLLIEALMGAAVATCRRSTAPRRRAWTEEALALAVAHGDQRARTNLRALLASILCELGEVGSARAELDALVEVARTQKLYFVEMVVLTLAHSWAAMSGDRAEIEGTFGRLIACFDRVSTSHKVDTVRGAALFVPLWDPDAEAPPAEEVVAYLAESELPVGGAAAVMALRKGQPDAARLILDTYGVELETDNWFSPFLWALGAEIGLGLGRPDLAARAYTRLAPYGGTCVISGTAPAHGPVDAYLALAAAATGETDLATEHADAALELIRAWRIPQVERWLLDLRERHGF
ncbi:ATP-binding protein [Nocardioides insulae]|uniref:ATP-binding protein n=1 Tax=Nocardioides insulae TaxID=394734 RepID=UPI0004019E4D|nr:BTAD domain-containing putative transcriptional regulator [Nocardioides insulae]